GNERNTEDPGSSLLGDYLLPSRYGRRHDGRRLAHHQDHGPAHHEAHSVWRVRRRNRKRPDALRHCEIWYSGQHHPHGHGGHRRGWCYAAPHRRSLGDHSPHHLRLGPHHSRSRLLRRNSFQSIAGCASLDRRELVSFCLDNLLGAPASLPLDGFVTRRFHMGNENTFTSSGSVSDNVALLILRVACALPVLYHGSQILFGKFGGPGPQAFAAHQHLPTVYGYLV